MPKTDETKKTLDFAAATGGDVVPEPEEETPSTALANVTMTQVINFEDLLVGHLKLAHGLSQAVTQGHARPGEWVCEGAPPMKNPRVLPLGMAKLNRRVAWQEKTRLAIICYRHEGEPEFECPNCRTQYEPAVQGKEYTCSLEPYYMYQALLLEPLMPVTIEFARTGLDTARLMNTFLMSQGWGEVVFQLGSTTQQARGNSYFVPTANVVAVDPAVIAEAKAKLGVD